MSKKITRPRGQMMRTEPYKICRQLVNLPKLTGLKSGDYVYIEKLDNGCILLIPEKLN